MKRLILSLVLAASLSPLFSRDLGDPAIFRDKAGAEDVEKILSPLAGGDMVASFIQEKRISGSERVFRSSGRLILKTGAGMAWDYEKPFPSLMVLTEDSVIQRLPGKPAAKTDFSGNEVFTAVSRTISGVFTGDGDAIADNFTCYALTEADGTWYVGLVPKNKMMSSFIDSIALTGREDLSEVLMTEKSGDSVLYSFGSIERRSLRADEDACFSF